MDALKGPVKVEKIRITNIILEKKGRKSRVAYCAVYRKAQFVNSITLEDL